jgi:hypothetical protein
MEIDPIRVFLRLLRLVAANPLILPLPAPLI